MKGITKVLGSVLAIFIIETMVYSMFSINTSRIIFLLSSMLLFSALTIDYEIKLQENRKVK